MLFRKWHHLSQALRNRHVRLQARDLVILAVENICVAGCDFVAFPRQIFSFGRVFLLFTSSFDWFTWFVSTVIVPFLWEMVICAHFLLTLPIRASTKLTEETSDDNDHQSLFTRLRG